MAKPKPKKKKRKIPWILIGLSAIGVAIVLGWLWYKNITLQQAKFVKYPAFGIDIPDCYEIHGIDVSWYQNFIDWPSVKEMEVKNIKIGFAFIKATEGLSSVDKQFKRNWNKAAEAGVPRGAYHFFLANKSGKIQAQNFITSVKLQPGDLPPVLDIEQLYGASPDRMRKEVQEWLTTVQSYYHVKPIIYTYVSFYEKYLGEQFNGCPLWAAHYLEQNKPRINRPWLFWQHNEHGRVNGIVTRVDFNVFNGDSTDFENLLIK